MTRRRVKHPHLLEHSSGHRHPWWLVPDDEPAARRRLLHRAERGDRKAVDTLKRRYHLVYWGKHDRTILT